MQTWFLWADVAVATFVLVGVVTARMSGRLTRKGHRLFWLGFFIGMTWELAYYFNGPLFRPDPPYLLAVPFPIHPIVQPLGHSLWDAGLFMVSVWLVRRFVSAPHFVRFRWAELGVMILWGQVQELCVELVATGSGVWTFVPSARNPALFTFAKGQITLVPQLIWFVAPIVFYLCALRISRAD